MRLAVRPKVVECVCSDLHVYRQRVERRVRNIEGMAEITWAEVEERRVDYQPWSGSRLVLDTAGKPVEALVAEAVAYIAKARQG